MQSNTTILTLIAMATSVALTYGCGNQSEPIEPNPEVSEQAGEAVEEAVEATQETAAQAAAATQEAASKAAERTREAVEETGDRIESATD